MSSTFAEAQTKLKTLTQDPGNATKLTLYGLYKQATAGKCNAPKPGMFDMAGKAKWDAWNSLGNMSKEEAEKQYVITVDGLLAPGDQSEGGGAAAGVAPNVEDELLIKIEGGLATITFNRPTKRNACSLEMLKKLLKALNDIAADDNVTVAAITGAGDYYSSGNDLNNVSAGEDDLATLAQKSGVFLKELVASFIDFPKILVALVNGPAIGFAVTTLALCDLVYASDKATFLTPFTKTAQAPEACSSYLFPKLMGSAQANEMLMLNRKLTAREAFERKLVTEVIPHKAFRSEATAKLNELVQHPKKSLLYAKLVNRHLEKDILHKVNDEECTNLTERWQSEDFMNALMAFFSRKSKI